MAKAIKDPNTAAYQASTQSPKQSGQACPYTYDHIFIYPLRYALVEETIDIHPAFQPGINTKIKPMGLRLARKGYFYYIHSNKPDKLRLKIITSKGAFAGESPIKFPKQGMLWFYFSEIKWTEKKETMIVTNEQGMRDKLMQKVFLSGFSACDGSDHLMPWSEGSQRIAECKPLMLSDPLAKQTSNKTQQKSQNIQNNSLIKFEKKGFYWSLNQVDSPGGHHLNLFDKTPPDQSAFILMFDVLGVLKDLTNYQGYLAEWEEYWRKEEQHKFFTADFIEGLYTYKFDEAKQKIANETQQKVQISEQQNELLKKMRALRTKKEEIQELLTLERSSFGGGSAETLEREIEKAQLEKEIKDIEHQLEREIGSDYEATIDAFDEYGDAKDAMKSDCGGLAPRVKALTRLKEMTSYLAEQRQWLQRHDKLRETVVQDRAKCIPKFYKAAWYFDTEDKEQHKHYGEVLFGCVNYICDTKVGIEFANDYFIAQSGIQNILDAMPTDDTDWLSISSHARRAVSLIKRIKSYKKGFEDAKELSKLLLMEGVDTALTKRLKRITSSGQKVRNILEPAYRYELEKIFRSELKSFRDLNQARVSEVSNKFIRVMEKAGPGMHSLFFEGLTNGSGVGIKLASQVDVDYFEKLVQQLNKTQVVLKNHIQAGNQLKQQWKSTTNQPLRKEIIGEYKKLSLKIKEIKRQQGNILQSIADMTDPLNSSGKGVISVSLTHPELDELRVNYKNLKQGIWKGYNTKDTGEAAKKLLKPGNLAISILVANIVNFVQVNEEVYSKTEQSFKDYKLFYGSLFGTLAAVNTFISDMWRKGLQDALENTKNPFLADKLAKVTVLSGGVSSILGFLSTLSYMFYEFDNFEKATKDGNTGAKVAIVTKQIGHFTNLVSYGRQTYVYGDIVYTVLFKQTESWSGALASRATILARVNLWLLVGSLIVIIGSLIYEYYNPKKIFKWVKESLWGVGNRQHTELESKQLLAEAISAPQIIVQSVRLKKQIKTSGYGTENIVTNVKYIINIMGFSPVRLLYLKDNEPSPIALAVAVKLEKASGWKVNEFDWQDITNDVILGSRYTLLEQGLIIEFELPDYLMTSKGKIEWVLSVIPDLAYKPLNSEEGYIRFGSLNIQRVGAMTQLESSDRLGYAHFLPLIDLRAEHIEMTGDNT
ncbi:toxin VasX [Zooshikella harenae]|uniref:Toxin VasX N-terminal region domain-containing protein n=1 Tax=Zooshikella harenae TaxID=2827238 RepID=A0ABS5ZEE2_9GAMM|nr:toxin VasX [Zooshikella harenae]MBU2712427.1 hypothetical protein [Zooshikella harenae]